MTSADAGKKPASTLDVLASGAVMCGIAALAAKKKFQEIAQCPL
jgi:hypothetical protein